jgi:hypothetical protein
VETIWTRLVLRHARALEWTSKNPVLLQGEPGYETDTGQVKIGDGVTPWNEMAYFLEENVQEVRPEALLEHINSETPHPAYDEGPSLVLLYNNKKV